VNYGQLRYLALQVRNQNGGAYRDKRLCQGCLKEKAGITATEDQLEFEMVWSEWFAQKMVKHGTCVVCGREKEIMTLPATQ
jgi:hypothetical protein